ncbi:MAG: zeta toxin family protein [Thermoleophilaceae bacterium]|nr:zeta toxin family protein [Thermoleophilaceae bacterium]
MAETTVMHRGHGLPYSKGLMAQALSATGLTPQRAFELAREVECRLDERGGGRVDIASLRALAEEVLLAREGEGAVRRYRDWHRLDRLDRPLIVMLGGAAGVGKSTLATMLAHRLGVTRVIATDVIRQVLRAFFTSEAMPTVHRSAFEVDLEGFREQAEHVGTGVAAIVERACAEGTPVVVEGVHVVPGALAPELRGQCVAVEALLVVRDEGLHRGHFSLRGAARPAQRYHEHFNRIRALQKQLEKDATETQMPVIDNVNVEVTLGRLMGLVLDAVGSLEERR